MTTPFTWSARLLDAAGNPAAGATLAVELFDLAANKWVALSRVATGADGNGRGRGEIGDDTLPFAPALRLVEGSAVMATTPAIARAARGISVDFGEVRRASVATPFTRTIGRGGSPFSIGGAAAATVDLAAVRAEVSRDFSDRLAVREREVADRDLQLAETRRLVTERETRLADTQRLVADREAKLAENVRVVGEKDAEIRRLSTLMAAKDQEIAALRAPRPAGPTVDAAAIRAEVTRDFSDKLAAREREVADRDSQINLREARLAESVRALDEKDREIRRLTGVIADKDRVIATPRPDRLAPEGVASITRVTDFASTIGVQLDDAQTALKSRGFSLGAIEVNAKALLQDEGRKIEILDREAMKTIQPGVLSDLKFSFRPDKPPPEVTGQTVPDLMFLTESRARAVLASLGLLLEASTGPAGLNTQAAPGQAMLQTPAAGTGLPRGGRVHVIFAAPKE